MSESIVPLVTNSFPPSLTVLILAIGRACWSILKSVQLVSEELPDILQSPAGNLVTVMRMRGCRWCAGGLSNVL
jgi:hypothetical protein